MAFYLNLGELIKEYQSGKFVPVKKKERLKMRERAVNTYEEELYNQGTERVIKAFNLLTQWEAKEGAMKKLNLSMKYVRKVKKLDNHLNAIAIKK